MPPRPPERILDDIVQNKGRGAPIRRKLAVNKERNWLLALTLNSFAKLAANAQVTDIEGSIVSAFRQNGFSDEQIKQMGQIGQRIPQQVRDEIFPGKFAQLNPQKSYSSKDMEQDADGILKALLAKPNVVSVDVQAIHAGTATHRDFPVVPHSVLREHASAITLAHEPTVSPHNPLYTIKAIWFKCVTQASDSIFDPANEPYWIFGSLGGGSSVTTRSEIFGEVTSGDLRYFSSGDGCIWGQNCTAQDLPDDVGTLISLWEHDSSDPDEIRGAVAAAFAGVSGVLGASGVASWLGAVVAAIGGVLQWLLGFMEDDHIADQTIVFSRQTIAKKLPSVGMHFPVARNFTDGDGDYNLGIRVTHAA